jgi:hypothetical protein
MVKNWWNCNNYISRAVASWTSKCLHRPVDMPRDHNANALSSIPKSMPYRQETWPAGIVRIHLGVWVQPKFSKCDQMAVCQNLVPLVNIKIAGKWMFIPLKLIVIGFDPPPNDFQCVNHRILGYPIFGHICSSHYVHASSIIFWGHLGMLWAFRPKAKWPAECWRLLNIASSVLVKS